MENSEIDPQHEMGLQQDREFRLVVNTIPDLVCTLKANWELELVNQRLLEYFGKTFEELKDCKLSGVIHPGDLETVAAQTLPLPVTGEPFEVEQRCRRYDGIFRWVSGSGHAVARSR